MLSAVSSSGTALRFACPALRADGDVVRAAVQQSGSALQFVLGDLRGTAALGHIWGPCFVHRSFDRLIDSSIDLSVNRSIDFDLDP